jgi:hypothetical protein
MPKPSPSSHPAYFQRYIDQVPEEDLHDAFRNQFPVMKAFLDSISEEQAVYAYAAGKWTLKEVLQHITDTERIFNYRALCMARNEQASLPGFDENEYAAQSFANSRTWKSLAEELLAVRHATELLFGSFNPEALDRTGTSNNNLISVASFGFMIPGHFYHHKRVIEERYL